MGVHFIHKRWGKARQQIKEKEKLTLLLSLRRWGHRCFCFFPAGYRSGGLQRNWNEHPSAILTSLSEEVLARMSLRGQVHPRVDTVSPVPGKQPWTIIAHFPWLFAGAGLLSTWILQVLIISPNNLIPICSHLGDLREPIHSYPKALLNSHPLMHRHSIERTYFRSNVLLKIIHTVFLRS